MKNPVFELIVSFFIKIVHLTTTTTTTIDRLGCLC